MSEMRRKAALALHARRAVIASCSVYAAAAVQSTASPACLTQCSARSSDELHSVVANTKDLHGAARSYPIHYQVTRIPDSVLPPDEPVRVLDVNGSETGQSSKGLGEGRSRTGSQILDRGDEQALVANRGRKAVFPRVVEEHFVKPGLAGSGKSPVQAEARSGRRAVPALWPGPPRPTPEVPVCC